ncbi:MULTISPECIES: hypothetical protein [Bacillus cereus group]|nr:hypothetical protein [Bacillus cereus]MDA2254373.1 hypothetical protein [Bacillus cereus]
MVLAAEFSFLFIYILALIEEFTFLDTLLIIFPVLFLYYGFYLLKKRRENTVFYWDDEGIIIDLDRNKVFWHEIEDIRFYKTQGMKSTVIYPHYTHHNKIQERRKKWLPTPTHSIDMFFIEKPKDYHKNLIIAWEEKRTNKNKRLL